MAAVDAFEVLRPGILTTVQDLGRPGFARYGVAPSGALDGFALRVANLLVGNPEDAAALETAVMGLRLKALRDVVAAVTGADNRCVSPATAVMRDCNSAEEMTSGL